MYRFQLHHVLLFAAAIALACGAGSAQASIQLTLGLGNSAIAGYPGPYGTVTVTPVDSNNLNVSLTAIGSYLFGDGSTIALNLVSNGTISVSNTPTAFKDISSGQVDGWGNFDFVMDFKDGFTSAVQNLSFTLTGTGGNWTSDAAVLIGNNDGYRAAGHVFVPNADDSAALATGYAADGGTVPEPATIIIWSLLGMSSWLGLRVWRRRGNSADLGSGRRPWSPEDRRAIREIVARGIEN
jgi:hypothetical protein